MIVFGHPMPVDAIFPVKADKEEMIFVNGGAVLAVNENGERTVRRLIATDPSLYLHPKYQPGNKI